MKIFELREQKAAKIAEARALLNTENLSAEGKAAFDKLKGEIAALEQDEARAQQVEDWERRAVGQAVDRQAVDLEQRVSLLRVVQAGIEGRAIDGAEREFSAEMERRTGRKAQGVFVPMSALETRVNTTGTAGALVPTERGDYIDALRNSVVIRQMGVRAINVRGNVEVPKFASGTTAGWVSENEPLASSGMTFGSITMQPRHVGGLSSWSRQLALQSDPSIEALLRDDLAYALSAAVDAAIIGGDGVKEPLGLMNRTGAAGQVQTASAPADWDDVLAIEGQLADKNIAPSAWYTTPAFLRTLRGTLKSASAGADYIATASRIGELPAYTSNAAPAGKAVLGDWSQIIFATWGNGLDILINPFETEAFSRGNVLIRAMMTCDIGVRHEQAFVVAG